MSRTQALQAVAAALLAAATGCSSSSSSTPTSPRGGADVTITIVGINGNMSFSPNPATVRAAQTVAWHNTGGTTHTATADGGAFNTGNIPDGGTSTPIRMSTAGSFPYHCSIHPTMVATLTVTSSGPGPYPARGS